MPSVNDGTASFDQKDTLLGYDDDLPSALKLEKPLNNFNDSQVIPGHDELSDCESIVLFIMSTLKIAFNLRHNQVGALLVNQNRYLILTCIKGTKGDEYARVKEWYKLLLKNAGHLVRLLQLEPDQIKQTLNILRCGLFSKDIEVSETCMRVFAKVADIINSNSMVQSMQELKFGLHSWLTSE